MVKNNNNKNTFARHHIENSWLCFRCIYKCYSERKNGNNLTTSVKLKIDILTGFLFKMQKPKTDYACQIDKDPNKGHPKIFLACPTYFPKRNINV